MNFYAWLNQHYGAWMYLLFLSLTMYIPVGIFAGYQILKLNTANRLVFWIGLLFVGIGLMGAFDLIANVDPPFCECAGRHVRYSIWFAWFFWTGKLILIIPMIAILRILHHHRSR